MTEPDQASVDAARVSARGIVIPIIRDMAPWLVAILPFMLNLWAYGIGVLVVGNALVIDRHLRHHKPVGSFQFTSLALLAVVAVSYFGFGNTFLLLHFGILIYGLLLIPVVQGELTGTPFTEQYAKEIEPRENWDSRPFFEGNRFLSRVWGGVFAVGILLVVFGTNTFELVVLPNLLIVLTLASSYRIAHAYALRHITKPLVESNARAS